MESLSYKKDKKKLMFLGRKNEQYFIGNKLYPLSKKKNIGFWYSNNTVETIRDTKLARLLDNVKEYEFKIGKCYQNAQVLYLIGKQFNLNIKYYSGWIFPYQSLPLHHAWNVLNNRIIIDVSVGSYYTRANQRMLGLMEQLKGKSQDKIREIYIAIIEEEMETSKQKKVSEDCLWGKVPQGYVYFGTEDTYENSIKIFNEAYNSVEVHPSYLHRRDKKTGESITQEMLKEKGLW